MQRLEWKIYQAGLETAQCAESLNKGGTQLNPAIPAWKEAWVNFSILCQMMSLGV